MFRSFISSRVGKAIRDYYLYDMFSTPRAAGAVNGTQAEPVGGVRTVTDANGKISIFGNELDFAAGGIANDNISWPGLAHTAGRAFLATIGALGAGSSMSFGLDANVVSSSIRNSIQLTPTLLSLTLGSFQTPGWTITNVAHQLAIVMRATAGFHFLAKGGVFTNWTLLASSSLDAFTEIPEIQTLNAVTSFKARNARIPWKTIIIIPIESDGFSTTVTDGAGHPEANGVAGHSYTDIGTWGVSAGKCVCSALSGGLGIRYLPTLTSNANIEVNLTRTAGTCGIVARYVDANNYLKCYHDGVNVKLDKVEAGVTTNLQSQAHTYAAGATLQLHLQDTQARVRYNGKSVVGTQATVPASSSLNHGIITTDVNATFDNLLIWARGNEAQYEELSNL